jgi:DNA primase
MAEPDLSAAVLARLRDALDALEVVGEHVRLSQRGRRWIGLCPFHEEKTPSFSVDPERGLYYCFGCHAGGDVIDFVMRAEKRSFPEAVSQLARRFGVSLPERDPASAARHDAAERLRTVLEEAQAWFVAQLVGSSGDSARQELVRRGFAPDTWTTFGFGWAPDDWRQLLGHLTRRHTEKAVVAAGLAVVPERGGRPYDRFRGRVTFPIRSADGRLVAFGGRAVGDGEPKYLNSPEGPLFAKRSTLFLLDRARRAIADAGEAIVVEGYFDALSLHRVGIDNAVATLGTALTADHARVLRRLAPRVLLCYDADEAGQRAAVAGSRVLLETGLEVAMLRLPEGVDPDDVVRSAGERGIREILAQPVSLLDTLLVQLPQDPAMRRRAGIEVAEIVGRARDPVLRYQLLEDLARRLDLPLEVVRDRAGGASRGPLPERSRGAPSFPGERLLVRILLEGSASWRQRLLETAQTELLADPRVRDIVAAARELGAREDAMPEAYTRALVDRLGASEATHLIAELATVELPALEDDAVASQLRVLERRQRVEGARRLQRAIETAQSGGDRAEEERLLAEKVRIRRDPPEK